MFGDSKDAELSEAQSQKAIDEQRATKKIAEDIEKAMLSSMNKVGDAYRKTLLEVMTGKKQDVKEEGKQ